MEFLRIVFGLLLIFVLPGVALIKWMFPRPGELDQEYNGIYVLALGMTTSVCLTILVGFILGSLPVQDDGTGWFDAPFIIGSLVSITLVFFILGWWRGAYPWLGLVHPSLARFPMPAEAPRSTKRHDDLVAQIEDLTREHDHLKREVKDLLKRERTHGRKMAGDYKERPKRRRVYDEWYRGGQKKIVAKVASMREMLELKSMAEARGLITSLVTDAGLTQVPAGTTTCLGIGPAESRKIDPLTGDLGLF
jgi:PTH2 family peptidyl-tRNA hydrolase